MVITSKKLKCLAVAVSKATTYSIKGFTFTYDSNLEPIPVEIPADIADELLQIIHHTCNCHYTGGKIKYLFEEVKDS